MSFHMPDSWYEPPEPNLADEWEGLEQDVDMLVREWADVAEVEVFAAVAGTHEPVIQISRVARDGEPLYDGAGFPVEFDTIAEARAWLDLRVPLPPPES